MLLCCSLPRSSNETGGVCVLQESIVQGPRDQPLELHLMMLLKLNTAKSPAGKTRVFLGVCVTLSPLSTTSSQQSVQIALRTCYAGRQSRVIFT